MTAHKEITPWQLRRMADEGWEYFWSQPHRRGLRRPAICKHSLMFTDDELKRFMAQFSDYDERLLPSSIVFSTTNTEY